MKTLRRVIALAALTAALPVVAHAQSFEKSTKLGVFAGASIPTGDLGDQANTGFNLGGLIEFKPALSPVGIRFDGSFNRFGWKGGASGNGTIWALTGNAVLSPTASPLYLLGGLGVYSGSSTGEDAFGNKITVTSDTKLGFNVGGGIRMPLTGFDTFIEARYHTIQDNNGSFIPISFGVRF